MKKYLLAGAALSSMWSASALPADFSLVAKTPIAVVPNWVGWYSGTQFGMECLSASHDSASTSNFSSSIQSTFVSPQSTSITSSTSLSSSISSSTAQGKNCGAKLGLYGGYNLMWGNNAVLGAQLEGGIANVRVNMTSIGNSISNGTSTNTSITVGPTGPVTATNSPPSTTSTLSNSIGTDTLDNRWQLSALARIGVLLDPVDLVYVLGGYTYARFDYLNNFAFGMNGGTIGGGWERQIVRGWTVRIEGRYTKFASKEVTTNFSNASNTSSSSTSTVTTSTTTILSPGTDRFSASVASVLVGLSYYFGTY
jgi:opacity protein-like surface antigen